MASKYHKEYYQAHKEDYKRRHREYRLRNPDRAKELDHLSYRRNYIIKQQYINKIKSQPCKDCGKTYPPYCMDFDHKEPSLKKKAVSQLHTYSLDTIKVEIAKCEVVCANCHRIRSRLINYNKPHANLLKL